MLCMMGWRLEMRLELLSWRCYNRSLACTRVRCWAKRLPDNNCSRLIQRSLRASKDGRTQVIFKLEDTVVKVRSNWGKVHQRESSYIQESVANNKYCES